MFIGTRLTIGNGYLSKKFDGMISDNMNDPTILYEHHRHHELSNKHYSALVRELIFISVNNSDADLKLPFHLSLSEVTVAARAVNGSFFRGLLEKLAERG